MKFRSLLPHLLIATCTLGGCFLYGTITSSPTPLAAISSNTEDADFESYTSDFFAQEIVSSTLNLHYTIDDYEVYGIMDPPITFGSFSTDSTSSSIAIENQFVLLSAFSYDGLSKDNQLTYDVIQDYLTNAADGTAYPLFSEPLTPYTGLHTQLPILLAEYSLDSKEDITTYLELLSTLPDYFDSLLAFEQAKSRAGLFMSNIQLDTVIEDCIGFILMEDNYLISTFDTRIEEVSGLTDSEVASFSAANKACILNIILPAYQDLIDGLELLRDTCTNAQGLCYYENGRNYYAYLIRANVGTSRTVPEIQVLIENQILEDLLSLQEASSTLTTSELSTPIIDGSSEELLSMLQDSMSYQFPSAADVSVTIHEIPEELQAFLSPAFYLIPTIDNAYENTIYMDPSYMSDDLTLYTTLAHEGYPGHLYQTTYFASTNPDPVRSLFNYGGYSEGWATYTEMCSYYFGAISSPESSILQKSASLNLGLYAYVDIGIHYEGWSLTDTLDYFKTFGITDSATIIQIYNLIVATPSNYLKYYVGYLEFLELKKECIDSWGEEFSQIRFHEAVLEVGPVSFDLLRKYVLE